MGFYSRRPDEVVKVVVDGSEVGEARISYGHYDSRRLSFFKNKKLLKELSNAYQEQKEILLTGCKGKYPVKYAKVYEEDLDVVDRLHKRLRFYARAKKN